MKKYFQTIALYIILIITSMGVYAQQTGCDVLKVLGDDLASHGATLRPYFEDVANGAGKRVKAWEFAFNAPEARINTSILESISTALGRSLKEMSEVVTHAGHPNITNYTVTHIFRGHGTGGHHHLASLISDNTKKLKGRTNIGGDGFYKADIEVNGTLRSEVGFFPDEWDELKVIDEVKHAWEEALSNPSMPVNGLYYGKTTTGQWIRMTKNNTYNNIQNAFPDFDYTP